jgi:hypothetical protein
MARGKRYRGNQEPHTAVNEKKRHRPLIYKKTRAGSIPLLRNVGGQRRTNVLSTRRHRLFHSVSVKTCVSMRRPLNRREERIYGLYLRSELIYDKLSPMAVIQFACEVRFSEPAWLELTAPTVSKQSPICADI